MTYETYAMLGTVINRLLREHHGLTYKNFAYSPPMDKRCDNPSDQCHCKLAEAIREIREVAISIHKEFGKLWELEQLRESAARNGLKLTKIE